MAEYVKNAGRELVADQERIKVRKGTAFRARALYTMLVLRLNRDLLITSALLFVNNGSGPNGVREGTAGDEG